MQRTYLAATALAATAALAWLGPPLLANTVPSRAPLGQGKPTGSSHADSPDPELMLRLAAAAAASLPTPPPPPPAAVSPAVSQSRGIVALEVVPYRPSQGDS